MLRFRPILGGAQHAHGERRQGSSVRALVCALGVARLPVGWMRGTAGSVARGFGDGAARHGFACGQRRQRFALTVAGRTLPGIHVQRPEPVVTRATTGVDELYINPGAILEEDGRLHMYANVFTAWPGDIHVAHLVSEDGIAWELAEPGPVLSGDDVPFTQSGIDVSTGFVASGRHVGARLRDDRDGEAMGARAGDGAGPRWSVDRRRYPDPRTGYRRIMGRRRAQLAQRRRDGRGLFALLHRSRPAKPARRDRSRDIVRRGDLDEA